MKSIIFGLALVAVIGWANSAPLSDEQKVAVEESVKFWSKMTLTADVKKMLDTVHNYFPSAMDLMEEPGESLNLKLVVQDLAKLGKQEGCEKVLQYDQYFSDFVDNLALGGLTDRDLWLLTIAMAKKNNQTAYNALEAHLLCSVVRDYKRQVDLLSRSDIKNFIDSTIEYFGKIEVSTGVEKMLDTVHKYYPRASVLSDVTWDNSQFVSFMKDVAKWGKQENCDEILKYDEQHKIFDLPELGRMPHEEWKFLLDNEINKKNPVAYKGLEASWLCNLLWQNPMYLGFLDSE